ncbi:hypothetical protein GINT2_001700 [Glugoides intestinalis]
MCRIKILEACITELLDPSADNTSFNILRKACRMALLPSYISPIAFFIASVIKFIEKVDDSDILAENVSQTVAIGITCWASFSEANSIISNDVEIIEITKNGLKQTEESLVEEMDAYPQFKTKNQRIYLLGSLFMLQTLVLCIHYAGNMVRYLIFISGNTSTSFSINGFLTYLKENSNGFLSLFNINSTSFRGISSLKGFILLVGSLAAYACVHVILHSLFAMIIYNKAIV